MFGAGLVLFWTAVVLLAAWEASVQVDWSTPPATTQVATPTSSPTTYAHHYALRERTLTQVWNDWNSERLHPAIVVLLYVLLIIPTSAAFLAWLQLLCVHRCGRAGPSYHRAFRSVVSCGGVAVAAGDPARCSRRGDLKP
jgi:hypothetical protein